MRNVSSASATVASGFGGPKWMFRISLANFADETYEKTGDFLMDCARDYVTAWEAEKK